jgi:hypothetical protein
MLHRPKLLLLIGFLLVLIGFVFPFLMVMGFLESTLFLNFFSFTASMAGLMLGMIGAVMLYQTRK